MEMKISLIQTASNRRKELARFTDSLKKQLPVNGLSIQYIFVDQGDNKDLFDEVMTMVDFIYVKTERCSLSKARNIGLNYADGDVVSFPDDDCWLPQNLLSEIHKKFMEESIDGFTGIVTNETGIRYNKYPCENVNLSRTQLCGASSICMFLKRDDKLLFDENLGVGSKKGIGSGEESDYLIRYLDGGRHVVFQNDIVIHHPITMLVRNKEYLKKSYSYAIGAGYVAKKNHLGFNYILMLLIRPIVGVFVFLLKGDPYMSNRSFHILRGRIKGLTMKIIK